MLKVIVGLVLVLAACGKDGQYKVITETVIEAKAQDFEGVFYFEHGSIIELVQSADGDVSILSQGQLLTSVNPQNDTFAQHPVISRTNEEVVNGKIAFSVNLNYTSGQDVEQDVSGANITGRKRTDVLIELIEEGRIRIKLTIYSDQLNANANYVIATRIFEAL
jgi:predicted transcriptional regulator